MSRHWGLFWMLIGYALGGYALFLGCWWWEAKEYDYRFLQDGPVDFYMAVDKLTTVSQIMIATGLVGALLYGVLLLARGVRARRNRTQRGGPLNSTEVASLTTSVRRASVTTKASLWCTGVCAVMVLMVYGAAFVVSDQYDGWDGLGVAILMLMIAAAFALLAVIGLITSLASYFYGKSTRRHLERLRAGSATGGQE